MDVAKIVQDFKKGSTRDYDAFVHSICDPNVSCSYLIQCLQGLRKCVSDLGKACEYLIGAILRVSWASMPPPVVIEYQTFLINLISAHTYYLRSCVKMLVKLFLPKCEKSSSGRVVITDQQKQKDSQAFINGHTLLKSISEIVPLMPKVLMPILVECYPFVTKHAYAHECYVRNVLQIAQYLPSLRKQILTLLVERMLELDARAPRKDIQEAEDKADSVVNVDDEVDMFDMDSDNEVPPTTDTGQDKVMAHSDADKLDILMDVLLQFINSVCYKEDVLHWEATKTLYKELLYVFDAVILPTYSSCHVQYTMFYITSFKLPLCEGYIDYLWKKVKDPNTQPIFRQAAVAYLSGYVSRAKFVPVSTAQVMLQLMVEWVHKYIKQSAYSTLQADIIHHGPFYSVCQAIFYMFIFRHKEILNLRDGLKFCESLNFQAIVMCRLNPLRICLPVVVRTFASVARQHQIVFCDTIIERNNRSSLPVTTLSTESRSNLSVTNALDSFFPFDPYLLNRSQKYIEPLYRDYGGQPVVTEDQHSEEEDDFLPEEETSSATFGKSPAELMMYGTSPGFEHMT